MLNLRSRSIKTLYLKSFFIFQMFFYYPAINLLSKLKTLLNPTFHEFNKFCPPPAIKLLRRPKTQLNLAYASGRQRAIQVNRPDDPYTQGVEESIPQTAEKVPGQPPSRPVTQTDCPHRPTARKRESISTDLHCNLWQWEKRNKNLYKCIFIKLETLNPVKGANGFKTILKYNPWKRFCFLKASIVRSMK